MKNQITFKIFQKATFCLSLSIALAINLSLPNLSVEQVENPTLEGTKIDVGTQNEDSPIFKNPVCLLVGLNSTELSYHEISNLSGFELFSVPYRSDIMLLIEKINPSQIIIRHPSGFVGLYSTNGQLVRGVEVTTASQIPSYPSSIPANITQPTEANPNFENVYYPGSVTGQIPHGGIGYSPPPKGRGIFRHLLKLAAFGTLQPFQYPGNFNGITNDYDQMTLFSSLFFSAAPTAVFAAASTVDANLDAGEYNTARTQPRDYMFQPVIEGY